jgi:hypothetical protein
MHIFISETNETYDTRQTSSVLRQYAQRHCEKTPRQTGLLSVHDKLELGAAGKLFYQHVRINPNNTHDQPKHYTVST